PGRAAAVAVGGTVRLHRRAGAAVDAVADRAHRPRARSGAARLAPPGRALRPRGTGPRRARTGRRLGAADRRGPGRRRRGAAAAHPAFQQLAVRWGCPGSPGTGRARARPAPAPPRPVVPEKRMNAFRLALPALAMLLLA